MPKKQLPTAADLKKAADIATWAGELASLPLDATIKQKASTAAGELGELVALLQPFAGEKKEKQPKADKPAK